MKPDGVATAPSEPMEAEGVATAPSEPMEAEGTEPITKPTCNDGASQNGTTPSQPDEPQNEQAAPPTVKEASGKAEDAKSKSKSLVKGKIAAATTGPGTRPKATQNRVANGLTKTASSTLTKKPLPVSTAAPDKKKPTTTVGSSGPSKKPVGSSTAIATSRAQSKATTAGTCKSTTTITASRTKTGLLASTATSLSKRPATAATSAATKPKTTGKMAWNVLSHLQSLVLLYLRLDLDMTVWHITLFLPSQFGMVSVQQEEKN